LIKSTEHQKTLWRNLATTQKESNKLESVLILLQTLRMKFNVMGMIDIEKRVICDVRGNFDKEGFSEETNDSFRSFQPSANTLLS
jgi:hypothetical protein